MDFYSNYCRCLGEAFVKTLTDLDIPEDVRKEQFLSLQQENEAKIRELRAQKTETEKMRIIPKDNFVGSQKNSELPNSEKVKEYFQKRLCPCCGKRLHKQVGKYKINWSCLTLNCSFYVIEDRKTGENKIIHDGKEVN